MIATSCYSSCNLQDAELNFYSISGDRGKSVNYNGKCYRELAPKLSFWKIWHANIGKIPTYENDKFYITEYYKQVLLELNAKAVYEELDSKVTVLLCYEQHDLFCHRHIVSAWLELMTGKTVPEIVQKENGELEVVSKPTWIKRELAQLCPR